MHPAITPRQGVAAFLLPRGAGLKIAGEMSAGDERQEMTERRGIGQSSTPVVTAVVSPAGLRLGRSMGMHTGWHNDTDHKVAQTGVRVD